MALRTAANGFVQECESGQMEICVRMCYNHQPCTSEFNLWIRQENEPDEPPDGNTTNEKWCSYVSPGPLGQTSLEWTFAGGGMDCTNPVNTCGISGAANDFEGEMICWCVDGDMVFPMCFDVIVNFFGSSGCSDPLPIVCIEYFVDGGLFGPGAPEIGNPGNPPPYDRLIHPSDAKGEAGNNGQGDFPQPQICIDGPTPSDITTNTTTSTCWTLSATLANGLPFVNRGPGRAPSAFVIPDDADPESCILIEDGVVIPRSAYKIVSMSEAKSLRLPTYQFVLLKEYKKGGEQKKETGESRSGTPRLCSKCQKRKQINLF